MPRFVVLEHVWNGVHWDFMLECGDVLRTWAVDTPIVAGKECCARALSDHRLIYLEYEGELTHDRGRVRRVDKGTYHAIAWSRDRVCVVLAGSQLVGEIDLRCIRLESEGSESWTLRMGNLD
jgi:DNA polymerase Ligase (LigD)